MSGSSKLQWWVYLVAILPLSAMLPVANCAQTYQMLPPPPATIQPPSYNQQSLSQLTLDQQPIGNNQLDAYSDSTTSKVQLRPWQTLDIPVGSWGASNIWAPDQLNSTTIERFRKAFVQNVELGGGYIGRGSDDDLGYSWASAGITMVVPLKKRSTDSILLFTPSYRVDWIDGPNTVDVPAQLHSQSLVVGWRRIFSPKWTLIAGVQPGRYNDDEALDDGFRLTGLALLNYQMIPDQLTLSFGVVYTGRNDVSLIPGVGLTWIPNPDTRVELNFPKPKIARRLSHLPYVLEDWVYFYGAFGGGEWAVQRTSGIDDELTLREFRVGVGFERILNGGTGFNLDIGYVFGRELEYLSGFEQSLDESFVIEVGMRF